MASFLRFLLALVLLPLCWSFLCVLWKSICIAAGGEHGFTGESVALLGGMAAFTLSWVTVSRPVRAYVLGHELTHAFWGMLFGARASDLKVGKNGGSVRLTKSNFLVTLAPYFFPFYTFVVIVAALVTAIFVRPLPWLPLWMFMIGFTWAFHVLFTVETLSMSQPDIRLYGRLFSWTVILVFNVAWVLVWLAATTELSFSVLFGMLFDRVTSDYLALYAAVRQLFV